MTTFDPPKNIIINNLSDTFADIVSKYSDYGLVSDNILLQDIAFLLKQSFKLNGTRIFIDSKHRSILSFIKLTYGSLKSYITEHTNCDCSESNSVWRCVIGEDIS
jgi:hypothetical protein